MIAISFAMVIQRAFRILLLSIAVFILSPPLLSRRVSAATVRGIVVRRISGCDYYLVQNGKDDYAVLEWYGDHDPDKGDVLVGNMKSYGMKTLLDETADESTRAYIEDYSLSKSDALEKLLDKCE